MNFDKPIWIDRDLNLLPGCLAGDGGGDGTRCSNFDPGQPNLKQVTMVQLSDRYQPGVSGHRAATRKLDHSEGALALQDSAE